MERTTKNAAQIKSEWKKAFQSYNLADVTLFEAESLAQALFLLCSEKDCLAALTVDSASTLVQEIERKIQKARAEIDEEVLPFLRNQKPLEEIKAKPTKAA